MNNTMGGTPGIKSGFMPLAKDATEMPVFTVMVNDTKPMWLYCGQEQHCQKGMVMAVNAYVLIISEFYLVFIPVTLISDQIGLCRPQEGEKTIGTYKDLVAQQANGDTAASSGAGDTGAPGNTASGTGTGSPNPTASVAPSSAGASAGDPSESGALLAEANSSPKRVIQTASISITVIAAIAIVGL